MHKSLPNDDLDLQIIWLELIEDKGFDITSRDMAKAFYEQVPYGPGEYAVFLKNYERGIYPPTSGKFNNRYYKNGMGCPIRSEIWACIFPGDLENAKKYIRMDGSLDHESDSIDGEIFFAAVEERAFFTDDLRTAVNEALDEIPEGKLKKVLNDTLKMYDGGCEWKLARNMILKKYGHADCTNLYQNMGFTLLSLLWGEGNFLETVRLGIACGYDTDCICASAASILGIMLGADKLLNELKMSDSGLSVTVRTRRKNGSIYDLSRDVCAVGVTASLNFSNVEICNYPEPQSEKFRSPMSKEIPMNTEKAPFKLWINGRLIGEDKNTKWWTVENRHFSATLNKGVNTVILKYAQLSDSAKYSIVWRKQDGGWIQYGDMGTLIKS